MLSHGGSIEATTLRTPRVPTDQVLPSQADVVNIGSGIIGMAAVLNQAERAWIAAANSVSPVDARTISASQSAARVSGGLTRGRKAAISQVRDGGVDP